VSRPKLPRSLWRQLRARPRLAASAGVGLSAWLFLRSRYPGTTGQLVAWDIGTALYLALAATMMLRGNVERMRSRARLQDVGAATILGIAVAAAVASLAAIVLELGGVKNEPLLKQAPHFVLAGLTIVLSWCFVHTAFALHYAHEFYVDRGGRSHPCLEFPGGGQPDYLDFLYFSFVIGTTSQTADVCISSRSMRRLALAHGVIAFFFNTTLLALTVNIAASLI
jgi:uncharacterized membrane protein